MNLKTLILCYQIWWLLQKYHFFNIHTSVILFLFFLSSKSICFSEEWAGIFWYCYWSKLRNILLELYYYCSHIYGKADISYTLGITSCWLSKKFQCKRVTSTSLKSLVHSVQLRSHVTCFCLAFTVFSKQKWELQWTHLKNVRYLGNREFKVYFLVL